MITKAMHSTFKATSEALSSASPARLMAATLGISAIALFAPELAPAAASWGDIGRNVGDNAKGVAKGITLGGYAGGLTGGLMGVHEMYKASKRQPESTYMGGIMKVIIGAMALGIGEFLGAGSASLFGSDQTTGLNELGIK
jgi:hypothetical protein